MNFQSCYKIGFQSLLSFHSLIGDMWSPGSSIREILEEQYCSFPEDVRSQKGKNERNRMK